jgi:hypothetical protein
MKTTGGDSGDRAADGMRRRHRQWEKEPGKNMQKKTSNIYSMFLVVILCCKFMLHFSTHIFF